MTTQLVLVDPVEIGRSGDTVILVAADDVDNLHSIRIKAQLWRPDTGYSEPKPLQVMLKFLYYVEETTPPQPWRPEAIDDQV